MLNGCSSPTLVRFVTGQACAAFSLAPGVTTIGRARENVRELRNVVQRAAIESGHGAISTTYLANIFS